MRWLNIEVSTLRKPELVGYPPAVIGTWLRVLAWCFDQENGGQIVGGAGWGNRLWAVTCGVRSREVRAAGALLRVEGSGALGFFSVELHPEPAGLDIIAQLPMHVAEGMAR